MLSQVAGEVNKKGNKDLEGFEVSGKQQTRRSWHFTLGGRGKECLFNLSLVSPKVSPTPALLLFTQPASPQETGSIRHFLFHSHILHFVLLLSHW